MNKWVKLKDVADIYSGGTPSRSKKEYWNGDIPWISTSLIQNSIINESNVNEYITEKGLKNSSAKILRSGVILMAMYGQGKTRGQVAILNIKASINQACAAINVKNDVSRDYIYQFLLANYSAIRNISNSGSQRNLNAGLIKQIPILLPSLPEQNAIADILQTWDTAIEKTEALIAAKEKYLKGQIQKFMSRQAIDANGYPEVHLSELFVEVTRKVEGESLTPYSISAGTGFVSQREKWGKDVAGSQYKNYTHLIAGEFSYNKGNSKRYQQGCIYLLKHGEICVPNVFISFKAKTKNIVPEFFEYYFIADYHARELKRYITSGARSDGLLNLSKKEFFKMIVPCPSLNEQRKIALALSILQHEIDVLKQLAEKYRTQKRGLMQKLLTGEWRVKV